MNPSPDPWTRLVAAARRAPVEDRDEAAPSGFATRVVARAFARAADRPWLGLIDRFAWRALGVASGLAIASIALNFAPALQAFEPDPGIEQDPVAVVLDLSR